MLARLALLACFLLAILAASPVRAQVGASITLTSNERFRGRSVSRGDPAVRVNVSFDHPSGAYIGAAATASIVESEPRIINVQANIGFVHTLASGPSLDLGVVRSNYSEYASGGRTAHYTEIYAGVLTRKLAFYVHYSPDYFSPGVNNLYVELDGVVTPAPDWHLTAHVGGSARLAGSVPPDTSRLGYDWRVGASRSAGPFEVQLSLSGGGPTPDRYDGKLHDRTAITLSLVWSL